MPGVIDLLSDLVAINSSNASMPDGAGEAEIARFVAGFGERVGAQVRLEEALPGRPNVYLTLPATQPGSEPVRRLLFDIHLDTVPLTPMADALSPKIKDGRMWARGACDTKSSFAAALTALARLAGESNARRHEILLLGTVDEEFRKRGVIYAAAHGLTADAAIVGEPTGLRPIVAHKGAVRWRTTTVGKAAHTSRPENGNNAILQMMAVLETIQERIEPGLAMKTHPLLTPPTLTVGRIEGGVGVNIVPERCWAEFDRRTLPNEDPDQILAEIDAAMRELMRRRPEVHVERHAPYLAERGLETPVDAPVVRAVQDACRRVLGPTADVSPGGVPYGTDGTALRGIPAVVLGPGDISQAHSADEWVDLSQVEHAAEIYYHLMRTFTHSEW